MAKTSVVRRIGNGINELREHWDDPPEGQIPLGDTGLYTSPNLQTDKAVDPRDCGQYPDSPYCGGNPWSRTPVGFDSEWGINECGAWFEATPVLGFTKLPPVSIGYRFPGKCREEEKPEPPPLPEPEENLTKQIEPLKFPNNIDPNISVFVVLVKSYIYKYFYSGGQIDNYGQTLPNSFSLEMGSHSLKNVIYPANDQLVLSYFPDRSTGLHTPVKAIGIASVTQTYTYKRLSWTYDTSVFPPKPIPYTITESSGGDVTGWIASDHASPQVPNQWRYLDRGSAYDSLRGKYFILSIGGAGSADSGSSVVIYGTLNEIKKDWEDYAIDYQEFNPPGVFEGVAVPGYSGVIWQEEWKIAYISVPDKAKQPPPPDNGDRKRKCCMQCCSGSSQQANKQNQDNAEILKLLREINRKLGNVPFAVNIFDANENAKGAQAKRVNLSSLAEAQKQTFQEIEKLLKCVGIDEFPILAPSSIVSDESKGLLGDIGDLKNKIFKQRIESIAELLNWKIKNDFEVFGHWQEYIDIQDSDPSKKGNQPKRVVLPNMARSFRELVLLNSIQIKTTGLMLDAVLKLIIEVLQIKKATAVTEAVIRDVQDFLDYPTVERNLDIPIGFTIPSDGDSPDDKEDIQRFMKPSHTKANFDDWTGEGSIHDMLVVLLDAASMIRAQMYGTQ